MADEFDPYFKWLAIPPEEQPPNHYRLLGVPLYVADLDVITHAADKQMAHLRTFQVGKQSVLSQKLLNEVSTARICLLNVERKAAYDAQLKAQIATKAAAATPPASAPTNQPIPVVAPTADFTNEINVEPMAARKRRTPDARRPDARRRDARRRDARRRDARRRDARRPAARKPAWQVPAIIGGAVLAAILIAVMFMGRSNDRPPVASKTPISEKASSQTSPNHAVDLPLASESKESEEEGPKKGVSNPSFDIPPIPASPSPPPAKPSITPPKSDPKVAVASAAKPVATPTAKPGVAEPPAKSVAPPPVILPPRKDVAPAKPIVPPANAPRTQEGTPLAIAPFNDGQARGYQEAGAAQRGVPVEFSNSIGMKFVFIPPGRYLKGDGTKQQQEVTIEMPFYLGVCEVTQDEYFRVTGRKPNWYSPEGKGQSLVADLDTARFPAEQVSWRDAVDCCKKLSDLELRKYRLPSDAEWEYACRAGTVTTFHYGNQMNGLLCNCNDDQPHGTTRSNLNPRRTVPVGSYTPNAFGLFDMHGNVWEWCSDHSGDWDRVNRGGGFGTLAINCQSASRGTRSLDDKHASLGFRIALNLPTPLPKTELVKTVLPPADAPRTADGTPLAIAPFDAGQARGYQEAGAKQAGVPVEYTNSYDMKFRYIPPGVFMMGSDIKGEKKEVKIEEPFYLGMYEVTQGDYLQIMGSNPSHFSLEGKGKERVKVDPARLPFENASYKAMVSFCENLSRREQRKYRLPKEAEWEYACRAGTTTPYAYGASLNGALANCDDNHPYGRLQVSGRNVGMPATVGSYVANPFGVHDMHGNISEWCPDSIDGSYWNLVVRGGSYGARAENCQSGTRSSRDFSYGHETIGFRVALNLPSRLKPPAPQKTVLPPADAPTAVDGSPLAVAPFDWGRARGYQEAAAKKLGVPVEYTNSIDMKFVLIPAGTFLMGDDREDKKQEVRVEKPFYLGMYELTQGEFLRVFENNPSHFSPTGKGQDKVADVDTGRLPVEQMSWNSANAFVKALSTKDGRKYRFPKQAEWEFACRAGTTTPYHYGSAMNGVLANCNDNEPFGTLASGRNAPRTMTVGSYAPNAFGLFDMHGNVCEWCVENSGDWDRITRGGGLGWKAIHCQAGVIGRRNLDDKKPDLGFRVALDLPAAN